MTGCDNQMLKDSAWSPSTGSGLDLLSLPIAVVTAVESYRWRS